jgi:hypothetical protein
MRLAGSRGYIIKIKELTSQVKCDQLGSEGTELGFYLIKLTKMTPAWFDIAIELITSPDLPCLVAAGHQTILFLFCFTI